MSTPVFHSSLSLEEIVENFKDVNFFSSIMDGLEEALAHEVKEVSTNTFA